VDGIKLGSLLGMVEGPSLGLVDGELDGPTLGSPLGTGLGWKDGVWLG
jgi:hypothetical protein